jgi:hypothetical protein
MENNSGYSNESCDKKAALTNTFGKTKRISYLMTQSSVAKETWRFDDQSFINLAPCPWRWVTFKEILSCSSRYCYYSHCFDGDYCLRGRASKSAAN